MKKYIMFLLSLILTLVLAAAALGSDLDIQSQNNVFNVCKCSEVTNLLIFSNNGLNSAYFLLKNDNSGIFSFDTEFFSLMPNETKTVIMTVKAPCTTGSKDFIVSMDANGQEEQMSFRLNSVECNPLTIGINNTVNTCPNSATPVSIQIRNSASFPEVYSLALQKYEKFAAFSENTFVVAPGEVKNVMIFINLPDPKDKQNSDTDTLFINAQSSKLRQDIPLFFQYDNCYDFTISAPDSIETCDGFETKVPISVISKNPIRIDISTDARWAAFDYDAYVFLNTNPVYMTLDGGKSGMVTITAVSALNYQQKTMSVTSRTCTGLDISVMDATVVDCELSNVPVIITNHGVNATPVHLLLQGPAFASLELPQDFVIAAGANATIPLVANPCNSTGKYDIIITDTIFNNTAKAKLNVIAQEQAFKVEIDADDFTMGFDPEQYTFAVRNVGSEPSTFTVQAESMLGILPTTPASLAPNEEVDFRLTLQPNENTQLGNYDLNITIIKDSAVLAIKTVTVEYTDGGFKLNFKMTKEKVLIAVSILLLVVLLAIIVFVVREFRRMPEKEHVPMEDRIAQKADAPTVKDQSVQKAMTKQEKQDAAEKARLIAEKAQAELIMKKRKQLFGGPDYAAFFKSKAFIVILLGVVLIALSIVFLPIIKDHLIPTEQTIVANDTNATVAPPEDTPPVADSTDESEIDDNQPDENETVSTLERFKQTTFYQYANQYKYYVLIGLMTVVIFVLAMEIVRRVRTKQ